MHLLLAEDDKISRDLLRRIVESEGHSVVLANDGEEAWTQMVTASRPFDAAIFDICMPGLGGLDVVERMRGREHLKDTPVILCSAVSDRTTVQRAGSLAVTHYVVKPYSRSVMLEKLRRVRESCPGNGELEVVEVVCQRLGIDAITHREMLGSVIDEGKSWAKETRLAKGQASFLALYEKGRGLKGSCLSMGAKGMALKLEAVKRALETFITPTGPAAPELEREKLEGLLTELEREIESVRFRAKLAA